MKKTINELVPGLAWAGAILVLALAATYGRGQGYIDQDTTTRLVIGANGLMIAYFGNRAPKMVAPSACAQQISRFAGWSLVLSGLLYAGFWAFAPIQTAITLGTAAVLTGMIATLGYGLQLRARAQTGK
jgi:hypothetical protein